MINLNKKGVLKGYKVSEHFRFDGGPQRDTVGLLLRNVEKKTRHYLVGRQVATCQALTSLGTRIKSREVDLLKEAGFPLYRLDEAGSWHFEQEQAPITSGRSGITPGSRGFLSSLLERHVRENDGIFEDIPQDDISDGDSEGLSEGSSDVEDVVFTNQYRHAYANPFEINALAYIYGIKGKTIDITNWPGGQENLGQPLPVRALGPNWGGDNKRRIPFFKVVSLECRMNVILKHTHWGKKLSSMCVSNEPHEKKFALGLKKRIQFFLNGQHDPDWKRKDRIRFYGENYIPRRSMNRSLRFLQILNTIDGMFAQLYLSDITAGWSFQIFDNFTLRTLSLLISDEFFDGDKLGDELLSMTTHYEALKGYRGELKRAGLESKPLPPPDCAIAEPFRPVIESINRLEQGPLKMQVISVVSQTRGCGTPPPLVTLKSKYKILSKTSEEPPPLSKEVKGLIRMLTQKTMSKIPDYVFSGLATKAGIHISPSACFEETRSTGGTTEHIRSIVHSGRVGRPVRIIDLNDMSVLSYKKLEECTEGEYIFWRCLEEVLCMDKETLKEASLVMVKEPGKARSVTKARAALKIVLDLVNGICSYPLKKGVESSSSGMGRANHGWNFYKEFYSSWKDIGFRQLSRSRSYTDEGDFNETTTYQDVFVSCTDYEEATDNMHHGVARIIGKMWMSKCGIPKVLQGIVCETCFSPRTIYFSGTGPLEQIGVPSPVEREPHRRKITLRRGVLMGDPLTKVILHLVNINVRETSRLGADNSALDLFPLLRPAKLTVQGFTG